MSHIMNATKWKNFIKTLIILVLCTLLSFAFREMAVREENILMIYLIGVIIVNIEVKGYSWGIIYSFICVFVFNFFFTMPYYTFRVYDANYIVMMVIFLVVSLLIGMLVSKLQLQLKISKRNESRIQSLFEISSGYLNLSGMENIMYYGIKSLYRVRGDKCVIYLAENLHELKPAYYIEENFRDSSVFENDTPAKWCFINTAPCGFGTAFYSASKWKFLPIKSGNKSLGVIGILCEDEDINDEQMVFVNTILSQMALAIERELLYFDKAESRVQNEKDKIENVLLNSISKEFEEPLGAIVKRSNSILTDLTKEETIKGLQDELTQNYKDSYWLHNLTKNLRHMVNIQEEKFQIDKKEADIIGVIKEVLEETSHLWFQHEVIYHAELDSLFFTMDEDKIKQVLINLLENAIRHTRKDATIHVNLQQTEDNLVLLSISDNGGGIEPGIIPNIFEDFGSSAIHKNKNSGIGLGLRVSWVIIKAHGGDIKAENNKLNGTTISCKLPLPITNVFTK